MATEDRVRVPKAGEIVASHLRRQIILGKLDEGTALPSEAVLMERFGVSRPTLREGFRVLESEGLISVRRGARGGARVHLPTGDTAARYAGAILQYRGTTLADVYEARALLESRAASLLADRHEAEDLDRLNEALARCQDALADHEQFMFTDVEFHLLVVELTGNRTLRLLVGMLYRIVESATVSSHIARTSDPDQQRALVGKAHRANAKLVVLIRNNQADEAEAFWRRHLTAIGKILLEDTDKRTVLDLLS
ncbi:FCD domain-containing protein [Frankia sp. Cppng1_Ct_nod]|uniref:FadR/GntR family transcriptional regulator n=1 Tax=Frankia sp. Cppng1_Ct_nod TaxID=2897162 RepID=UPI00104194B1|nr:FCD domain-containing protein [Frankia sp. Cppng1_Ct_nod]